MGNVDSNACGEEYGFLRNKPDLASQPFDVQVLHVDAIESDRTRQRVVETLDERYNS